MKASLPIFVYRYLRNVPRDPRALAILKLNARYRVVESSGDLERYGITDIDSTRSVEEFFLPLVGLLPIEQNPFVIKNINLPGNRYVDMHIISDLTNKWVLITDRTRQGRLMQRAQQKRLNADLAAELYRFS